LIIKLDKTFCQNHNKEVHFNLVQIENADLKTYFVPSAAWDPMGTWEMKALAAAPNKAA
jgi:hypothetical protein